MNDLFHILGVIFAIILVIFFICGIYVWIRDAIIDRISERVREAEDYRRTITDAADDLVHFTSSKYNIDKEELWELYRECFFKRLK